MDFCVTLIGSFRRDKKKLEEIHTSLSEKFTVLSPESVDFSSEHNGFVKTDRETNKSIQDIEVTHLEAIRKSDMVILHAPEGYVGNSASLEIGYAVALGIPVFADEIPSDVTIASMIDGLLTDMKPDSLPSKPGQGMGGCRVIIKKRHCDEVGIRRVLETLFFCSWRRWGS